MNPKIMKNSGKWVGCKNYQINAIETYIKNIEISEVETKYTDDENGATFSFVKGCDAMIYFLDDKKIHLNIRIANDVDLEEYGYKRYPYFQYFVIMKDDRSEFLIKLNL